MGGQPDLILDIDPLFGVRTHTPRTRMVMHRNPKLPRPLDSALRDRILPARVALGEMGEGRADPRLCEGLEGYFAFVGRILAFSVVPVLVTVTAVLGQRRVPLVRCAVGVGLRVRVELVGIGSAGAGEPHDEGGHGHLDV